MALTKQVLSWPLTGGLDSSNSPLIIQPGSHLVLDDVTSERLGEWKNRNGFTQTTIDSLASAMPTGPSMVANIGELGIAAMDWRACYVQYPTATSSGRWKVSGTTPIAVDDLEREPIALTLSSGTRTVAFSSDGTTHMSTMTQDTPSGTFVFASMFDTASAANVTAKLNLSSVVNITRCAAGPSGFLITAWVDTGGNLTVITGITNIMNLGFTTVVKTGCSTSATGIMDCMYYSGTTVTIVVAMVAGGYQFIEFDPNTRTKSVDVNIAAGTVSHLSCIADPSASGIRMVGLVESTPNTRIHRLNAAGAVQTNDVVEAVLSISISGCATSNGAEWAAVYRAPGSLTRRNAKVAGVVGTPANVQSSTAASSTPSTVIGQGWGEPGDSKWFTLFLCLSPSPDPQFNVTLMTNSFGFNGPGVTGVPIQNLEIVSQVAPDQSLTSVSTVSSTAMLQAVRTGVRSFYFGMPVLSRFATQATPLAFIELEMTAFDHTLVSSAELTTVNTGKPTYRGDNPIFPANSIRYFDGFVDNFTGAQCLQSIGMQLPVKSPVFVSTAVAGGLTPLGVYQWCWQVDVANDNSETWRSGPSVPITVTLTGGNTTVTLTFSPWQIESQYQKLRIKLFRTNANGSQFRLVSEQTFSPAQAILGDVTFVDNFSDAAIAANEILYTAGEQANIPWPATSHCWMYDDRLWAVNRDFRTEVQYSKNLQANHQPETTAQNVVDIDDQYGDITNGIAIDSTLVVFKREAIYFVQGNSGPTGGFDNAGTGTNYTVIPVSQGVGSLPGTPVVVADTTCYFVTERGIYTIDRSANLKYAGQPIDQWFNQPQVNTPETVYDAVFIAEKNEVRFVTTNYIFVHDRNLDLWSRWTSPGGWGGTIRRCLSVDDVMVLFGNDGKVWREGGVSQTTDQGNPIAGVIRSAWIRPKEFGQIKLWKTLATALRTSGGGNITPTMQLFTDDSDVQVQSWSPPAVIAGATTPIHMEARPQVMNCSSFSVQVTLPSGDTTFRLEQLGAEFGLRSGGAQRRPASERWG